jgi:tetratricopeptide (TPR) repeat protein
LFRFRGIIPILITVILHPLNAQAGDLIPDRLVRPAEKLLRNRLATAHLVRGHPFEVNAIFPSVEVASALDHYNVGMAMSLTGRYIKASEAFQRTILNSEPASELRFRAIKQFIRMSGFNPGLDLPPLTNEELRTLRPDLSLALSGYFADRNDQEGALASLEGITYRDAEQNIISGILTANHLAAKDRWDASSRLIGKIKVNETSALVDLLYLTRGYHYLQGGQPDRAKNSFLAISPSSPYSSEALLGKAWSLIRTDDLQGATIVLEELLDLHRYSRAAGDGVMDLALCYRQLGLYDRAGTVLDHHLKRLQEVRNWLLGLQDKDLQTGRDIVVLLEWAIDGSVPDRGLLLKTPFFVRQWVMDTSVDPYVKQTTALLKGLALVGEKVAKLRKRLDRDDDLVRKEIDWVKNDITRTRAKMDRLEEIRNRLESIRNDMSNTLQTRSPDKFASEKAMMLISRTAKLKERLSLMENSVSKADGFTSLVGRLSKTMADSKEENQLNMIRKQAYDGLISSRLTLRNFRNTLTALEGQLWLEVKGGAIRLEKKTSLRVTSGRTRAGQALADTSKTIRMLASQQQALEELGYLLLKRKSDLDTSFPQQVKALKEKIDTLRAARLLTLAVQTAQEIREAEARTLYTSADIEISRMESTIRSLQEAVQ